ncbi:MAG: hypothetical protein NZ703_01020, partial [Gemmataceae bacterium]|nr:hypothetical protein [Gemmataceae bacterium]
MVPRRLLATTGLAVGFGLIALTHTHSAPAATPQQINAAIDKGMAYTKKRLQAQGAKQLPKGSEQRPVAEAALAGLALLECGLSAEDDTLKRVTAQVREASFSETQTYHLALYILYLDRLGDPADVPIIQMLAVRLLAGQNPQGGWTYGCPGVSESMETMLRNALLTAELRSGQVQPARDRDTAQGPSLPPATDFRRLHPAVARYAGQLQAEYMQRNGGAHHFADDNSNTQFAILGLWAARKHGVPVEAAFNLIEKRFLATQCPDGGWPYSGKGFPGSASMTCVGLLGLATAVGRRQERLLRTDPQALPTPQGKSRSDAGAKKTSPSPDDPFFRPPPAGQPSTNGTDDPFFRPPPTPPPAVKEPNKPAPKKPAGPLAPPLA